MLTMTTTTYNVIHYPTAEVDSAITILSEGVSADKALRDIAKLTRDVDGAEIVPNFSVPAALHRFGALQSWELYQDGQKIGLVGITVTPQSNPLPTIPAATDFTCAFCEAQFADAAQMNAHYNNDHNQED
jgi:hypothetical protein